MTTVSRTFTVDASPEIVIPYLADFAHAVQWDPGTVRCERIDDGPVTVGSSWRNTSKIVGISTELSYTLEQLSDERIVLVGRNDTATSTETIDVTAVGRDRGSHTPTSCGSTARRSSRRRLGRSSLRSSATTPRNS